jgi:hypothetical protein
MLEKYIPHVPYAVLFGLVSASGILISPGNGHTKLEASIRIYRLLLHWIWYCFDNYFAYFVPILL